MRNEVELVYPAFNERFEGRTNFLYLDRKKFVTTGAGNLVDPMHLAERMPWRRPDGSLADRTEIRAAWSVVKQKVEWSQRGGGVYASLTTLRLDWDYVDELVISRLRENAAFMHRRFAGFDEWPADAQLGVLSMAWAMGAHKFDKFPMFCAAARREDFATCARECEMGGLGVEPRNAANKRLFWLAASVVESNGCRSTLHWIG